MSDRGQVQFSTCLLYFRARREGYAIPAAEGTKAVTEACDDTWADACVWHSSLLLTFHCQKQVTCTSIQWDKNYSNKPVGVNNW